MVARPLISRSYAIVLFALFLFVPHTLISQEVEGEYFDDGLEDYEDDVEQIIAQADNPAMNQPAIAAPNRNLNGFADTPWQTTYKAVFQKMKNLSSSEAAVEDVQIVHAEPEKSILVKRNGILYRYNFYKTPLEVVKLTEHDITKNEYQERDAILFHVKVSPPFIASELIYEKLKKNYGEKTRTTVDDTNMGVHTWELNNGVIFQWYEPYRDQPYTRTIDYMSLEIAKTILKEYEDYFDSREKKLLQEMILN